MQKINNFSWQSITLFHGYLQVVRFSLDPRRQAVAQSHSRENGPKAYPINSPTNFSNLWLLPLFYPHRPQLPVGRILINGKSWINYREKEKELAKFLVFEIRRSWTKSLFFAIAYSCRTGIDNWKKWLSSSVLRHFMIKITSRGF